MAIRRSQEFWERVALVALVGAIVSSGVTVFLLFQDWRQSEVKEFWNYAGLLAFLMLPFVALWLIAQLVLRKK